MAKRRKARSVPPTSAQSSARWRNPLALVAACAAVALVWTMWRPTPLPGAGTPASGAAAPSGREQHYSRLVGEWVRPDGGYVLSVSHVSSDGAATVAYLNPQPIRVASAQARGEGTDVGLFVKFDDVNYRGSTYTLAYDAVSDQLKGIYFQATQGAQYDVYFTRRR